MTRLGVLAGARRRVIGPPVIDTFTNASIDGSKWVSQTGGPSIVAGRLRTPYPNGEVDSGVVINLSQTPVWVQIPTVPTDPNGTINTMFWLSDSAYANIIQFTIYGNPKSIWTQGNGITPGTAAATYSPTTHAWLRHRINAGNLLFESSPDGKAWTTLRSVTAPTWLLTTSVRAILAMRETGTTQTSPGYAEWDNFCVTPA